MVDHIDLSSTPLVLDVRNLYSNLPSTPKSAPSSRHFNWFQVTPIRRDRSVTTSYTPLGDARRPSLFRYIFEKIVKTPPNNDSNISDRLFCRICHEGELSFRQSPSGNSIYSHQIQEALISPCKCSGTVGLIHRSCLEKWLSASNDDRCEICGFQYRVVATPKSLKQWLFESKFGEAHKNLSADIICFVVLTPLALISAYLCASGACHYLEGVDHKIEAVGLIFLTAFLVVIYFVWMGLTLRFHLRTYRSWQNQNQDIRLVDVISNPEDKL